MKKKRRKEKETILLFFPFVTNQPSLLFLFKKKNYSTKNNIDSLRSDLFCTHAWMHVTPSPRFFHHHDLFPSLCYTGSIYGDAVSGLSGGVLPLANQNRSTTRGEPGQRAVKIGAAKDGTAADMVESNFLPLCAQETADYAL